MANNLAPIAFALFATVVGLVLVCFPRAIQRGKQGALRHDPFGELFRPGVEGEGFVLMLQVMGVLWILLGLVIAIFAT